MVKKLLVFFGIFLVFVLFTSASHPVYITVTEIEHNTKENSLEISCKIFTDDLEKVLRSTYKTHIDLQDENYSKQMNNLLAKYIPAHLKLRADGNGIVLKYIGYEIIESSTYAYFETPVAPSLKKLLIQQDLLFEQERQQMGIVHAIENGKRSSVMLQNPDKDALFSFPIN